MMRRVHGLSWLAVGVCTTPAAAAPVDSAAQAGLSGRLRIEVTQAGPVGRSLTLDFPLTSEPSGPSNPLAAEGLTEGQQAAWDHRNRTLTENMIDPEEMTRVWTNFAKSCDPAPESAACARARGEVEALEARSIAANARAEAQLASGPAMDADSHRFQKWGGNPDRGCGTVVSRVGAKAHRLAHSAGDALTAEAVNICSSQLVLDRRTGRAFLKINPLIYFAPGDRVGTFDLEALARTSSNVIVEPGGRLGSPPHAVLRELQVIGSLDAFTASARLPARTGAPLHVKIEFRKGE
jgi:hypothetical protein